MNERIPIYTVSVRLQRTTTEFASVSVPVTSDLVIERSDGSGQIDVDKLVQRAVEMGHAASVEWQAEDQQVQPHPIQTPPPGPAGTV